MSLRVKILKLKPNLPAWVSLSLLLLFQNLSLILSYRLLIVSNNGNRNLESYLNIPLAHIQGETSGNIDDKVRNSITQLSDYHYPTHNSLQRILQMGAECEKSFNFGCPSIDLIANQDLSINSFNVEL